MTIPITTARFTSPEKLPPVHASSVTTLGRRPAATMMLPMYWTAGVFVAMSIAYPTIATGHPTRMNDPHMPFLSDRYDTTMVKIQPVAFGGMERSWA